MAKTLATGFFRNKHHCVERSTSEISIIEIASPVGMTALVISCGAGRGRGN